MRHSKEIPPRVITDLVMLGGVAGSGMFCAEVNLCSSARTEIRPGKIFHFLRSRGTLRMLKAPHSPLVESVYDCLGRNMHRGVSLKVILWSADSPPLPPLREERTALVRPLVCCPSVTTPPHTPPSWCTDLSPLVCALDTGLGHRKTIYTW